jgi:hypothetical protein
MSKKKIHLFFRKPFRSTNLSVENWYLELIKKFKSKDIDLRLRLVHLKAKTY